MTLLAPVPRHFAAGCPHETAHRLLGEALSVGLPGRSWAGVSGQGCGSLIHAYLGLPFVAAPPGRGPSVARGLSLVRPGILPLVYLDEGELAGEGLADLLRAARAGAPMLVVSLAVRGEASGIEVLAEAAGTRCVVTTGEESDISAGIERALAALREEPLTTLLLIRGQCPAARSPGAPP